jgi:hypothetical protein
MNSNALTTRKLHAENAKRVSGEFYRYTASSGMMSYYDGFEVNV